MLRTSNMSEIQPQISPDGPTIDTKAKEERRAELAKKAGRFRILIVGRANAGKTTILKKICNTTEDPEIHDRHGDKVIHDLYREWLERVIKEFAQIDLFKVEPTSQVSCHALADEITYIISAGNP
jgi:septin family protein